MTRYLDKETSAYLVSLGCRSESGKQLTSIATGRVAGRWQYMDSVVDIPKEEGWELTTPAFDLMDILRKENAEKIWPCSGGCSNGHVFIGMDNENALWDGCENCVSNGAYFPQWEAETGRVLHAFQSHPDTWTEEVAKLINPEA